MTLLPNRINISEKLTPERELELAQKLLNVQSEEELDHFLPLLAAAAPMLTQLAGPLLKGVAGSLFGGGGGRRKRRPQNEQEQFLGKIIGGLFGQGETESQEQEQFLGGILKGLLGGMGGETELESYEQEQFLGGLLSKVLGGLGGQGEAESYEQEQFLGGIVKGLLGGEMETEGEVSSGKLLKRARRFVRLVHSAARHAAREIAQMQQAGQQPDEHDLGRIVLGAIVRATRRFNPRLAAYAFPSQQPAQEQGEHQEQRSLLESMISGAVPLGGGGAPSNGRQGRASWVKEGNRMIFTL